MLLCSYNKYIVPNTQYSLPNTNTMKYTHINPQLFIDNRKRFTKHLSGNSIAIFNSNALMPRSADSTHVFRQNPDLFYLTGVDQEDTALIIYPKAPLPKYREILFVRRTNDVIAVWEGEKLTQEQAREVSGVQTVMWMDEFDAILGMLMNRAETCYLNLNEHDRSSAKIADQDLVFAREIRERYPLHRYERSAPIMEELRTIKSKAEVDLIKQACGITEKAFRRVLQFTKPGVYEYEIEAEVMHEFLRNRATGYAYYPIIASGKDSCILHYNNNNKQCKDGDVLLLDFGAEYANYSSDMTRTIPVNGRFTKRQKEVYNAVLRVMKGATAMLRPGTLLDDYNKEVGKLMESELIGLGLLNKKDVAKQNPDKPLYKKYYMHGTSHYMGLDTHDVGSRYAKIEAGMVFTCEPGIYIPEESIGIRIENDILVTDGKPNDLMKHIPIEVEEIEELMNAK